MEPAEILRGIPVLAGLDDAALAALATGARACELRAGDVLMAEGGAPDNFYVVVDGELEAKKRIGDADVRVATCGPGELVGEMGLLEDAARSATVVATRPTRVLAFDRGALDDLLAARPPAALALLRMIAARLRRTEEVLQRNERLAGLGRIAGGLAHELNNPAAAVSRGAAALVEHLGALAALGPALPAGGEPAQDPIAREAAERAIAQRLEAAGIAEAWELAPALASRGIAVASLDTMDTGAMRWIGHVAAASEAAAETREGARRIAELVGAVKVHTRVGRDDAPGEVDIVGSIDRTLLLFGHRLRGVRVERDHADDARVIGWAAELGQVWLNLIDNAVSAMDGKGTLTIRTRATGDEVEVTIGDSGAGIPEPVRAHLFEPFVTSKAPGAGSGLGLSICRHIVVQRHGGRIDVESAPGRTVFRVMLPRRVK